jgi:hypothetical protein
MNRESEPEQPGDPDEASGATGDDSLVIVHVCYSRPEAEVALSALHAAGIPGFIHSREMNMLAGHFAVALGGMQIMVPAAAKDDAKAILGMAEKPAEATPESAAFWWAPIRNTLWIVFGFLCGCVYIPAWICSRR